MNDEDSDDVSGEVEEANGADTSPKPLSSEYHHARRNLNLASALFFGWEFIGIDLAAKDGATEVETSGVHFVIKSPGAVPWVLLILVGFFLIRLWLEWIQCDQRRRIETPARIDVALSTAIALGSLLVFFYQSTAKVQLFEQREINGNLFAGSLLALPIAHVAMRLGLFGGPHKSLKRLRSTLISAGIFIVSTVWIFLPGPSGFIPIAYFGAMAATLIILGVSELTWAK
jgi:hypothetical protein